MKKKQQNENEKLSQTAVSGCAERLPTIKCPGMSKPVREFLCEVLRGQSTMQYQDSTDGKWKPVQKERWEKWRVLAETLSGAISIARYHFYNTDKENILVTEVS